MISNTRYYNDVKTAAKMDLGYDALNDKTILITGASVG